MSSPVSPPYRREVVAQPADIDELAHVSNLVYLRWVLEVAQAHSEAVGLDMAAYRDLGSVFVVRRHEIEYLRSAVARDRVILETWVESWRGASSVRRTRIVRAEDEVELARAATLWAFVALDSGRPERIPAAVRERFSEVTPPPRR